MDNTQTKTVYAVVGPTASGKTGLAVELALALGGEVISCDSMQIYRKMDIGTAKPTPAEMRGVAHHCIDICDPSQPFSAADYAAAARTAADDIIARGKTPIFCGGTGLYLDSAVAGDRFAEIKCDDMLRERLSERSAEENHAELEKVDPTSAASIHPNNTKRVIRALEIYLSTGVPKSVWDERSLSIPPYYDAKIIGLDFRDRAVLYGRIDRRVDIMLEAGLENEVRALAEGGAFGDISHSTAACAIGYKEFLDYFAGCCTYSETVERIKQLSRNYAKRQRTWFYKNPRVKWIYNDDFDLSDDEQRQKYVNIILTMLNC